MPVVQPKGEGSIRPPQAKGLNISEAGKEGARTDQGRSIPQPTLNQKFENREQISLMPENTEESELDRERKTGIHIEGLGHLDDIMAEREKDDDEGEGNHVVILHDTVTGAGGQIFKMGDVIRISKLTPSWGDDRAKSAAQIKRLFNLEAIREATEEESSSGKIEVLQQTPEMVDMARKMASLKRQNAEYEKLLGLQTNPDITGGSNEQQGAQGQQGQGEGGNTENK